MPDLRQQIPADFHALYDPGVRAARGTLPQQSQGIETGGHGRLATDALDLAVDYDEATHLPNRVVITRNLMPATQDTAMQDEALPDEALPDEALQSAASPEMAVASFVQDRGDLWNLSDADVSSVQVLSVSGKALKTVQLIQRVDGTEVFNSDVTVAVGRDNRVVSVAGQFFPGAADTRRAGRGAATSVEEAISCAARDLTGAEYDPSAFVLRVASSETGNSVTSSDTGNSAQADPYRFYTITRRPSSDSAEFERPVRVKDVLFPMGEGQFVPGYYLELWIKGYPAFAYVIDSVDQPDVLFRKNLAADAAFRYRVFNTGDPLMRPEDGPAPGSPHPTGKPDGFQAEAISERVIEVESLLPGDPWLAPGATTTSGNNCIAYADLAPPQGLTAGDVPGRVTSSRSFDYTYDHTKPASDPNNLQASLVGMFVHVNWLHDRWYEAGFDEAAGNAQQDNFGRGGIGGDPILAEGHDFSGTDDANMGTPADGDSPRMQMYEFKGVAPMHSRTSNFDAMITFHEMGHYITNRLVGNASGLTNQQGKAMGEGWGDFFAICMTSQSTDDFASGVFAPGGWTDITSTFKDNYYYSIRRYPYTADMTKNPLTFKHISGSVVLPSIPVRSPTTSGPNNEVHKAGEVWCTALWEVFVNLVAKHGHTAAERMMLEYVIGGLKLTPNRPSFTQARDGIVTAVSALDPGDLPDVWRAFAKRGLGVGAISPPSSSPSLAGVIESFDAP